MTDNNTGGFAREFEELRIWQDARTLSIKIYGFFGQCKDFGFRDQIQRSAVSVMNNIAEGFERDSRADFVRFLGFAKASSGEVRSMLHLATDLKYLSSEQSEETRAFAKQLSRSIKAFSKTLE